ncbi:MAG: ABC transporter ATP-binding protein [Acidimicrobiaceae bacterium]|uniref:ABC transporter ATP-binding protein n=1 Tax=Candidatus Poriferisodalis TaxID=2983190 RepID=UPI00138146EB|nr:ABC transporter ATP-binding protein [Candidatus Poriferisodalis multihospitum]MCY3584876.1 ABC transporter ATP-binding protein [Acidimicrobiaceae bacterium]MXY02842.1 ABC transporter ATP-binding protein [Acidimicrobiales bacterium]MCY3948573.1 ABC transporter ATP-binding protein [Acidimicrobiaceae bacterium]MDE0321436.1 ABC transporter ATP-binding protein [Acidimicrobiaceae bacterium]MDE0677912.1 ABC transporter ATP-binding protein [Acidimicrobiaceae bacterium]
MTDMMLKAEDLHARYGAVEVLRGLDFEVPDGNVVVILGANGAGKTTTLRALCNMCTTTGTVTMEGDDISRAKTADIVRRGVAHVPQGRGTFPELSVMDNLKIGAYTRKDNEVGADVDRWFEIFPRLEERRDQLAGSLSGGEQQMLAVARALMCRPRLLLLDEPSLGLAPLIIEDLFERFAQLNKETGLTMLLVEQNANLALDMADYGYVIESGEIALHGPADQLKNDPAVQEAYLGA